MRKARVLIVDDNQETRIMIEAVLTSMEDIEVIGCAAGGLEALEYIRKGNIDVMLLDIVMPHFDGIAVLEAMNEEKIAPRPEVIVLTGLDNEEIVKQTIALGANYYMVKPFDSQTLYRRIRDLADKERKPAPQSAQTVKSVDEKVTGMFLTIGIPAHIKGYQYLREAVRLAVENPDIINRITKELYPSIAEHFGTSPSKVERAIRHAIEVAWNRGRIETINQMFGHCVYTANDKPTNGEFVALIADKIALERR